MAGNEHFQCQLSNLRDQTEAALLDWSLSRTLR